MSVQAISWVINNSKNKGSAFVVLLMIANHAHSDGTGAYPSFDTLARESRITIRQVTNIIPTLERSRELVVERGRGPSGSNLYTIRMTQLSFGMEKISNGKARAQISNEPSLTVLLNQNQNHKICLCCGTTYDPTDDHIKPRSQGGGNEPDNIQPLCRNCNSAKGRHESFIDDQGEVRLLTYTGKPMSLTLRQLIERRRKDALESEQQYIRTRQEERKSAALRNPPCAMCGRTALWHTSRDRERHKQNGDDGHGFKPPAALELNAGAGPHG